MRVRERALFTYTALPSFTATPPSFSTSSGNRSKHVHLQSFPRKTDIRTWFANVEQHATEGVNKILIGNKCDWEEKRAVSTEQGEALAKELGIPFLEVSAKSNINIDKAFYNLASDIKKRIIDTSKNDTGAGSAGVNVGEASNSGSKCC